MSLIKTVSVYGYGRFGKFWADLLAQDFEVWVHSRRGIDEDELAPNQVLVSEAKLFESDAIFFCVAISALEGVLKKTKQYHTPKQLYFDTCSVKVNPVQWMKNELPEHAKIVATHPMFGPDSFYTSKSLLPMVMSNISAPENDFDFWIDYFIRKNLRLEIMTPDEHDAMVAYSQGITHYVGRVLGDLNLKPTRINTLGYEKLLEIIQQTCNDNWQLFIDLQRFNPYTKKMREDLHDSLQKIYANLTNSSNKV